MTQGLLYFMAFGALLGGLDCILGNRFGLGQRFEEAFHLLGPIALSMAGIVCLAPVLSQALGRVIVPLFSLLGMDPGMFGSILAIDMGGYRMAMDLCRDPALGRFAGIIVSAIFGCTVVFTVPVGLGTVTEEDRPLFTRGILLGFISMPGGILLGGLALEIPPGTLLWNCLPVFLLCGLLFLGLWRHPEAVSRAFQHFARFVRGLATLGLTLGAAEHIAGIRLLPGLTSLEEAMTVVCSISIVMLGSMPLAELLQRLLAKPFAFIGRHTGLNAASTAGLLIGTVSVVPALAMVKRMDPRGKVVCGAALVCGASTFAAHLGFALSCQPDTVPALLLAKLSGAALGILIALAATGNRRKTGKS